MQWQILIYLKKIEKKLDGFMKAMMNKLLLVLGLGAMISCSPKVVGIYNPGSLSGSPQSYHVYESDDIESLSDDDQAFDRQLVSIISENLEAKGLKRSSLPDIYVSFLISVHSSEETSQSNVNRFDYRYYNYGYYNPVSFNSRSYKQGVLIIDIRNSDNKLVWQGNKAFKLSAKKSSREELLTSCREIIDSFDPEAVR